MTRATGEALQDIVKKILVQMRADGVQLSDVTARADAAIEVLSRRGAFGPFEDDK